MLDSQGVTNSRMMHLGGEYAYKFGTVRMTLAHHGSMLPDGSNGRTSGGLLFTLAGRTLYHAGDTALLSDMQLTGGHGIDPAILPSGDNNVIGPEDSVKAAQFLTPARVVLGHNNAWRLIEQDANGRTAATRRDRAAAPVVLQVGETCDI